MLRNKIRNIAILLFSTIIGLFLATIIIEIYFSNKFTPHAKHHQFDSELGWINRPKSVLIGEEKSININSLGYRGEEVDLSKKHFVYMGDSIVFGTGVSNNETAAYLLNRRLKGVQVVNLAVSGYGIDQYYLRLKKELKRLNPYVIFVNIYPGNDFGETFSNTAYGYEKPFFAVDKSNLKKQEVNANYVNHKKVNLLKTNISKYSCINQFARFWVSRLPIFDNLKEKYCKTKNVPYSSGDYLITALLMKISILAKKYNAKLFFILSTSRSDFAYKVENPEQHGVYKFLKLFSKKQAIPLAAYDTMARTSFLRIFYNFKNRYGYLYAHRFYDFFSYLEKNNINQDSIFLKGDNAHFSSSGHEVMADFIYGILESNID